MTSFPMMILPIIIPVIGGALIPFVRFQTRRNRQIYVLAVVVINALITFFAIRTVPDQAYTLVRFSQRLSLGFRIDGLGMVFGGLVALLWPLATIYAFEYMKHEGRETKFFSFYTITFGITLGIAFSANFLTLYLFYELLTLITLPLVIHAMDEKAFYAGKRYLTYMIAGATLIFIGFIFVLNYGETLDFVMGGVFSPETIAEHTEVLRNVFLLTFVGFGVKAALFPFHGWLPIASVAPTTVTALLHAVAVVKAGVFAIMRVTYYSFGATFLQGTWQQKVLMALVLITILYGSGKAYTISHFKRRLAYSTVSQLSYILFGVVLMTPLGFKAALMYLVAHAFMKIVLFYCAGCVIHTTGRSQIELLGGLGPKMPLTFGCFTVAALALMGIPPTSGFTGKYQLFVAVADSGSILAWFGLMIIVLSVLLTAGYIFSIIKIAFLDPYVECGEGICVEPEDPKKMMIVPVLILTAAVLFIGIGARPLLLFLNQVVGLGV